MISHDEVRHIADLARLQLSAEETDAYARQLGAVVDYVKQLDSVDTAGIEPTCFLAPEHDPLRDDVVRPSLPADDLLRNGPAVSGGSFAVPKVIDQ